MSVYKTVHETVSSGIGFDVDSLNGFNVDMTETCAATIICAAKKLVKTLPATFIFSDLGCKVTQQTTCSNVDGVFRLDLHVVIDGINAHASYSVYKHNRSRAWVLQATANPTTLLTGNNVSPVGVLGTSADSYKMVFYLFKVPFLFLFEALNIDPPAFVKKNISRGAIGISNCQWAFYIPSKDRNADLSLLRSFYMRLAVSGKVFLGEFLGLYPEVRADMSDYSILLRRRIKNGGNNKIYGFSVGFYDKYRQMDEKGATRHLTKEQQSLLAQSIRVDITFHRVYLEKLIRDAKRHYKDLMKKGVDLPHYAFLDEDRVDAYMIARAVSILSKQYDESTGEVFAGSFTDYLINTILYDELKLDILLRDFSIPDIKTLPPRSQELFKFWKTSDSVETLKDYIASGVPATTARRAYDELRAVAVPIDLPYRMMNQLSALDAVYGLTDDELYTLNTTNSGEKALKLLRTGTKRIAGSRASLHLSIKQASVAQPIRIVPLNKE